MRSETDGKLLRLAARQSGIVARWQLIDAGVAARTLDNRISRGALERVHRSVYRVPGLTGARSSETALVFSCGPHAAASHQTAGELHGLVSGKDPLPTVTLARGHPDPRPDLRMHRSRITRDEVSICDGVPVTTPDRTLLDLATVLPARLLEQAVATALRLSLVSDQSVLALVARYPHRPGAARLACLLAPSSSPAFTRSAAEERFLDLLRRARLPMPVANARLLGLEVDFHWRAERLVVEIDGLAFHSSRSAQQVDRRRDATLVAAGLRVVRFTWSDLTDHAEATIATVAFALARVG